MKLIDKVASLFARKKEPSLQIQFATDAEPVVPPNQRDGKPIAKIPPVNPRLLSYAQPYYTRGRGYFHSPEWDLSEIGKIIDVESYVRQAFKKKEGLMFKEGLGYQGSNPRTIQYIKRRMAGLARASSIPTIELYKRVGRSLIQTSNAFLLKVRNSKASQGRTRTDITGKSLKPIAAYFPMPAESMQVDIDPSTQKVREWRLMMPDGNYLTYPPQDIVHFTIDKREGFLFGTPILVPVKDDIRALRTIEENVELLLYQNLFPLFHYKVGTETAPAGFTEDGQKEVDVVESQIRIMPAEGAIVTPERHEIKAIGSEGRALRAEGYLKHFQERVWSGLGVSSVDMGIGDTTNRACYSEDTETLTEDGWKYYWQINPETDRIATFNPQTQQMEFHKPHGGLYLYDYDGEMIRFSGKTVDVLVTPEHRMWVNQNPYSSEQWRLIPAENLSANTMDFKVATEGSSFFTKCAFFDLPHIPYDCYSNVPNAGPYSIQMDDWLEFLGYFISEGTYGRTANRWAISISQNRRVYPSQTEKIRKCFERLPFEFKEYIDSDDTVRFWIHCKSLYLYLFHEVGNYSYQKRIPREYLSLSDRQEQILFDALMLGDGGEDRRQGRTNFGFSSSSNELINQVQELCVRLGYRSVLGTGTRCNRLSITPKTTAQIQKRNITKEFYSGKVYCFNVPNHLFITRRNGKVGIHGNTANTMSRALVDAVKDIQDSLEAQWDLFIIQELLLESTFGDNVLEEENMVHLHFNEIDLQNKIETEQHSLEMFKGNAITYSELRESLNREPIDIPEDPEDQDPAKYPDWHQTFFKLFDEPINIIRAIDEPYLKSLIAAGSRSSAATTENITRAQQETVKTQTAIERAKKTPRSDFVDNLLTESYEELGEDLLVRGNRHLKETHILNNIELNSLAQTWANNISDKFTSHASAEMIRGFNDTTAGKASEAIVYLQTGREAIRNRTGYFLNRLARSITSQLIRQVDSIGEDVKITPSETIFERELNTVLDAHKYRIDFMWDMELRKSYNLGRALGARYLGYSGVQLQAFNDTSCNRCQAMNNLIIPTAGISIDDVPPFHPHSRMTIQLVNEETEDETKEERCVKKVKKQLRKDNPGMAEDKIKSKAFAICRSSLKDSDNV